VTRKFVVNLFIESQEHITNKLGSSLYNVCLNGKYQDWHAHFMNDKTIHDLISLKCETTDFVQFQTIRGFNEIEKLLISIVFRVVAINFFSYSLGSSLTIIIFPASSNLIIYLFEKEKNLNVIDKLFPFTSFLANNNNNSNNRVKVCVCLVSRRSGCVLL
jgi:hypothetical protein